MQFKSPCGTSPKGGGRGVMWFVGAEEEEKRGRKDRSSKKNNQRTLHNKISELFRHLGQKAAKVGGRKLDLD